MTEMRFEIGNGKACRPRGAFIPNPKACQLGTFTLILSRNGQAVSKHPRNHPRLEAARFQEYLRPKWPNPGGQWLGHSSSIKWHSKDFLPDSAKPTGGSRRSPPNP